MDRGGGVGKKIEFHGKNASIGFGWGIFFEVSVDFDG
jgi:hypothetical protein